MRVHSFVLWFCFRAKEKVNSSTTGGSSVGTAPHTSVHTRYTHDTSFTAFIAAATLTHQTTCHTKMCVSSEVFIKFRAILGNWDLLPFPCKYRSHGPIQKNPEDILISCYHPTGYRGNRDFPFPSKRFPRRKCLFSSGFRPRGVKSCGNIDFPNPVHTKTVHKKVIPAGIIKGTSRTYSYICRQGGWHRTCLGYIGIK